MRQIGGLLALIFVGISTSSYAQTTCTPTGTSPSVTICSPGSGATVGSPVQISAASISSTTVKYIQVYIDGIKRHETQGGKLSTSLSLSSGQHRLTVQAYNGALFKKTLYFTVSGSSTAPCTLNSTNPSVTICQPADGSTVSSPFRIVAGTTSSTPVQYMQIYVDYAKVYQVSGGKLDTTLDLPSGTHRITVQANNGPTTFKTTQNITVSGTAQPPASLKGVFTSKYNNARTGANTNETILTPANVNATKFGKKGSWTLDGNIFAQPLYASGLDIPGKGTKNVIFVATEHCSVYALNADSPGSTALWKKSFLDSSNGVTAASGTTSGRTSLGSEVCITGTPVIDPNAGTMYVSVMTAQNGTERHHLHAIDIRTGSSKMTPVKITATVDGIGVGKNADNKITFKPSTQNQRAALLLHNGIVYVAFGSFSDIQPYHGWLFAFSASNLSQLAALNVTPDTEGGAIWQAGSGPAADSDGNVYFITGDGGYATGDFGDSFVKVKLTGSSFTVMDWFTPYNEHCINVADLDLGSGGPMLLPPQGGAHPNLIVAGGKEGRIYVVDRDNMGKHESGSDSQIVQSININGSTCGSSSFSTSSSKRIYGAAAYWNGKVYIGSAFGPLRKYNLSNGLLSAGATTSYVYQASGQRGRGPIPIVSANGNTNGIVWAVEKNYSTYAQSMRAFDAVTMKQLYSTTTNSTRDSLGSGTVFNVPVAVNGKVIVTSSKRVFVFGLL